MGQTNSARKGNSPGLIIPVTPIDSSNTLSFFGTKLPPDEVGTLCETLRTSTSVKRLFLTKALFSPSAPVLQRICDSLIANHEMKLEELYLQGNQIDSSGAASIAKLLETRYCSIRFLDLGSNEFEEEAKFQSIVEALTKNRSLITLTLNLFSKLKLDQERQLAEAMKKNRTLYRLNLFNEETDYTRHKLNDDKSASVVGFRLMLNRNRSSALPLVEAFLMGTIPSTVEKPNTSSVWTAFAGSDLFDKNLLFMIFEIGFG